MRLIRARKRQNDERDNNFDRELKLFDHDRARALHRAPISRDL